jgi:ATP-dependent Zn protease
MVKSKKSILKNHKEKFEKVIEELSEEENEDENELKSVFYSQHEEN